MVIINMLIILLLNLYLKKLVLLLLFTILSINDKNTPFYGEVKHEKINNTCGFSRLY